MTYTPDIPAPEDTPSVSQGQLLTNFQQINTVFGVNHVALSPAVANSGKHNFSSFVEQGTEPTAGASESLIYSVDDGGDTELKIANSNGSFQATMDNLLYIGAHPVVGVNFEPSASTGALPGGNIKSSFNVSGINVDATGRYTISFTNNVTDRTGSDTRDYIWDAQVMGTAGIAVVCAASGADYTTVVNPGSIQIEAYNNAGNRFTPTRIVLTVYKVQ